MTTFSFKEEKQQLGEWAKHHKQIGIAVARHTEDGEWKFGPDEGTDIRKEIEQMIEEESPHIKKIAESRGSIEGGTMHGDTYYLLHTNDARPEPNFDQYLPPASNSVTKVSRRFIFQVDENEVIIDQVVKMAGNAANAVLVDEDELEENILFEIAAKRNVEKYGISLNENAEEDDDDEFYEDEEVLVYGISEKAKLNGFNLTIKELIQHLVAIEVYDVEFILEGED